MLSFRRLLRFFSRLRRTRASQQPVFESERNATDEPFSNKLYFPSDARFSSSVYLPRSRPRISPQVTRSPCLGSAPLHVRKAFLPWELLPDADFERIQGLWQQQQQQRHRRAETFRKNQGNHRQQHPTEGEAPPHLPCHKGAPHFRVWRRTIREMQAKRARSHPKSCADALQALGHRHPAPATTANQGQPRSASAGNARASNFTTTIFKASTTDQSTMKHDLHGAMSRTLTEQQIEDLAQALHSSWPKKPAKSRRTAPPSRWIWSVVGSCPTKRARKG